MRFFLLAAATLVATPAFAQDVSPAEAAAAAQEGAARLTVGVAMVNVPDYEGSANSRWTPAPVANGSINGMSLTLIGNRLSVDLIPDIDGPEWDLQAGPVGVVNFNRGNIDSIDDPRVRALGEIDTAIELGGFVGIAKNGVITSDFDRLAISLSYRHDVSGVYEGGVWTPSINYMTPLSTKALVGIFASAEITGDRYARTYFGVTPAGSAASGLPIFTPDGGQKDMTFGGAFTYALTGDLTKGLSLVAGAAYRRLLGDFADSPIVSIAGDRTNWIFGAGVAYTF